MQIRSFYKAEQPKAGSGGPDKSKGVQVKELTLVELSLTGGWKLVDNINNFKMKGGKSIYKYGKATRQKKFHLLTLVLHQKLLIK